MNIGIVVDNEFFNDIRVRTEAEILRNAGHNVSVLRLQFSENSLHDSKDFSVHSIRISRKKKDFIYATMNWNSAYENIWTREISKFIKSDKLEALHVHDLYMAKASRNGISRSGNKVKLILDLHENYPYAIQLYEWATKFPRNLLVRPQKWLLKEREYLSYADKIIVLSDYFANHLSEKHNISTEKFTVYPNVPDISYFDSFKVNRDILVKEDKITLFYFGAVAKRRGIYLLIEGFKRLKMKFNNLELLIIGPVDKKDKNKFHSLIDDRKDIIHYEWKDMSEFPSYVSYSDICVSPLEKNPQHESGVANKVYQYMLFEKPLLVSNCGPQEELVEKANAGLVYTHDSIEDFVDKAVVLIKNPEFREKLGTNGKNIITTYYNIDIFEKSLLELFKN